MGEKYLMLKLAQRCLAAGHDCIRTGNPDVTQGFLLICRTCRTAFSIPAKEDVLEELEGEKGDLK